MQFRETVSAAIERLPRRRFLSGKAAGVFFFCSLFFPLKSSIFCFEAYSAPGILSKWIWYLKAEALHLLQMMYQSNKKIASLLAFA
jgi:hypothetical protein